MSIARTPDAQTKTATIGIYKQEETEYETKMEVAAQGFPHRARFDAGVFIRPSAVAGASRRREEIERSVV